MHAKNNFICKIDRKLCYIECVIFDYVDVWLSLLLCRFVFFIIDIIWINDQVAS